MPSTIRAESFDGEIARFILSGRPLDDLKLEHTIAALKRTYFR